MSVYTRATIQWDTDTEGRPMAVLHTRTGLRERQTSTLARIEPGPPCAVIWGHDPEKPAQRTTHSGVLAARRAIERHARAMVFELSC